MQSQIYAIGESSKSQAPIRGYRCGIWDLELGFLWSLVFGVWRLGIVESLEPGGWVLFERQFDRKAAAFADFASHGHPPAMGFNNVFHDGQPDADALGLTSQFGAAPVKWLEDFFVLGWRDAFAMVLDEKVDG